MTDSEGNGGGGLGLETRDGQPTPDRRQRLVEGARLVLHQQGVEKTTLADVADAADVPVGNVYYYFKTKDALVEAVIDAHAEGLRAMFTSFEQHRDPRARLKAFVRSRAQTGEAAARDRGP